MCEGASTRLIRETSLRSDVADDTAKSIRSLENSSFKGSIYITSLRCLGA